MVPVPASGAQGVPSDSATARLERIRLFLEQGNPNQRSASLRQLREEIRLEDVDEFRTYLARNLLPVTLQHLRRRYDELLVQKLEETETQVLAVESARRLLVEKRNAPAGAPEEDLANDIDDLVRTREEARRESWTGWALLLRQGIGLAPALVRRTQGSTHSSYHVNRLRERLMAEVEALARRSYPSAPASGTLPPFERRALVPLLAELEADDPAGWGRFREEVAGEALELFTRYVPEEIDEARSVFLELGAWGVERLDRWAETAESAVPERLRRTYAEWNRLAVPLDMPRDTAIPIERYRTLPLAERHEVILRLQWTAGAAAAPVLVRILTLEPELRLQVEAAAALTRLKDSRGLEFLERLGFETSRELEENSRRVLLVGVVSRRETGDVEGALEELRRLAGRYPRDFEIQYEYAFTALKARLWSLAIRQFQAAAALEPTSSNAHYNLACACAMGGRIDEALAALRAAVTAGFRDSELMANDPDLQSLRDHPEFRELLESLRDRPVR